MNNLASNLGVTEQVSGHISLLTSIKNWHAGSEIMAGITNINGLQYLSTATEVNAKGKRWHEESSAFEL
jgi:hypothetical protein